MRERGNFTHDGREFFCATERKEEGDECSTLTRVCMNVWQEVEVKKEADEDEEEISIRMTEISVPMCERERERKTKREK